MHTNTTTDSDGRTGAPNDSTDGTNDGGSRSRFTPGRRDVLRAIGTSAVAGLAWSASSPASAAGAPFGDGVNLMPSYYCSGDQAMGWDLMGQHGAIQSVRIEIEPFSFGEVATAREDAKRWIDEAYANGYDVIATYHHYPDNGSADPQALQSAADFWAQHYEYLSQDASFTINLMNEWGNHDVSAQEYASAYDDAITTVRNQTSYSGSIVCDAPGWGQETDRLAEAAPQIGDDDLILSAHVYGDGWNQERNQNLQPSHLDVLDETDYPCMIGEFGANRSGPVDWSAVVDHANELGWPVFAWAWNGDGADQPMNMADPAWMNDCSATSYTTSSYFDEVYPHLGGGSGSGTGEPGTGGTGTGGSGGTGDTGSGGSSGTGTPAPGDTDSGTGGGTDDTGSGWWGSGGSSDGSSGSSGSTGGWWGSGGSGGSSDSSSSSSAGGWW